MLDSTKRVIDTLVDDYFDGNSIDYTVDSVDDMDVITINDNTFSVNGELDDEEVKNLASYIYNSLDEDFINQIKNISESIENEDISTDLFIYNPEYIDDKAEDDIKLSKYIGLPCKVVRKLITSKEEDDGFIVVTFDIEDNKDVDFVDEEQFIIFESDLKPYTKNKKTVSEAISNSDNLSETSTALLTALQSEKEAVMIYETLIKNSTDEEEISLLTKILEDEKEHIALLSGLQSAKTAEFVANDNKEELDDYAQDIIDTESVIEE